MFQVEIGVFNVLVPASVFYTRINTTFRAQLEDNGGSM